MKALLKKPLHVQFVMGVKNAMPVIRQAFDFMVDEVTRLSPESTWVAAGIGRHQLEVNRWCLERGGHCRTGLEDNIRWDETRLAASNAELVKRVAELCGGVWTPPGECRGGAGDIGASQPHPGEPDPASLPA